MTALALRLARALQPPQASQPPGAAGPRSGRPVAGSRRRLPALPVPVFVGLVTAVGLVLAVVVVAGSDLPGDLRVLPLPVWLLCLGLAVGEPRPDPGRPRRRAHRLDHHVDDLRRGAGRHRPVRRAARRAHPGGGAGRRPHPPRAPQDRLQRRAVRREPGRRPRRLRPRRRRAAARAAPPVHGGRPRPGALRRPGLRRREQRPGGRGRRARPAVAGARLGGPRPAPRSRRRPCWWRSPPWRRCSRRPAGGCCRCSRCRCSPSAARRCSPPPAACRRCATR
nr:hypothetical protein [Angustibacter aerolatus]